jgi:O-palmitoleoyl-L-serine hydrolase
MTYVTTIVLVLIFFACCGHSMQLVKLNDADALCNDGSPGAFYARYNNSASSNWIIHLQGGFWAWDLATLRSRSPELTSSNSYASQSPSWLATSGLFSQDAKDNPVFHDYNVAYVMYCSSDAWSGTASNVTLSDSSVWRFHGKQIIRSVLVELANRYSLLAADKVLFSGCSAGGQGVVNEADFARRVLFDELGAPPSTVFKAFADAGWIQALEPINEGSTPILTQFRDGIELWRGVPNEQCVAANPSMPELCYITQYAYAHIATPLFVQSEQYDQFQVPFDCCNPPFTTWQHADYVAMMRVAFVAGMSEIREPDGCFSAACFHHCSSEDSTFTSIRIVTANAASYSLGDCLSSWFVGDANAPHRLIDRCTTFDCSQNCPAS